MSAENVLKLIKDNDIEWVSLQFGDLFGKLQTFCCQSTWLTKIY